MRLIPLLVLPVASASIVARAVNSHAITMSVQSAGVKHFSVYLQKDDHLMREYVSRVLMMVCEISSSEALAILMEANRDRYKNRALCGTWEEPLAKHILSCLESAGLSVVITPFSGPQDVEDGEDGTEETYLDGTPIKRADLPRYYQ